MTATQPRPVDPIAAATYFVTRLGCTAFPVWGSRDGKCFCGDPHTGQPPAKHGPDNVGKHPSTARGFKDALADVKMIRTFLGNPGTPNYGLNPPAGVLVFDVDGDGVAKWAQLEGLYGALPATLTTITGNGRHYFFRWPESVGSMPSGKLWGFVIRRHDDGYIIGPGSVHPTGFVYDTVRRIDGHPHDIAELPEAWAKAAIAVKASPKITIGGPLPGVGGRHDWLRDKARHYAGVIRDPEALKAAVMAENARLPVPKSESEVERAIGEVLKRFAPDPVELDPETGETIRVIRRRDDDETEHYDQLASSAFPDPPARAAFGGLAGEVATEIANYTDASDVGLLAAVLSIAGGVLGAQGVYHTQQPSALMAGLVGVTAEGRKSTAIELAWRTVAPAMGADYETRRLDGLNSGEALVARMMRLQKSGSATGVLIEDEFSRLLVSARREGSTLDSMLRTAFDARALSVFTRSTTADLMVVPPYVLSALAAITPRELRKLITQTMLVNGSVNRWLWVPVVRRDVVAHGDQLVALPAAVSRSLMQAADDAKRIATPVPTDREAAAILNDYGRWLGKIEGLAGDMGRRLNVIAFRIALIHACLDRSKSVTVEHVQRALALSEYGRSGLGWVFGQLTGSKDADLLARAVAAAGESGLTMSDVTKKLFRNPSSRSEAVDTCLELGLARLVKEPNPAGTGRPIQRLVWAAGESWLTGGSGTYFRYFHGSSSAPADAGTDRVINAPNPPIELNAYREDRGNNPEITPVAAGVTSTATWARPCLFYVEHQSHHRQTSVGWTCDACHPEEGFA